MATDAIPKTETIPKLQPGDFLTSDEFERRYEAMPECKKAELIEGIVYMPSPTRFKKHGKPHSLLNAWAAFYMSATPGVEVADNTTNRLDLENVPQPDCMLFIHPDLGGQVRISDDDYVVGAPEFVAEVSGSSVAYDRGPKLRTFRRHRVKEYLIWRVEDGLFEWNILQHGNYEHIQPDDRGILRSETFPGLWLDTQAMLRGELAKVLEVLQRGIASPEHEDFVRKLQTRES